MRKSLMLMAALAAGLMVGGCQQDREDDGMYGDTDTPSRTTDTQGGTTAGPDRGTRSGGTSGTGTGAAPGSGTGQTQ